MKPLISIQQLFQTAWDTYTAQLATYTTLTLIIVIPSVVFQALKWGVLEKGTSLFNLVDVVGTVVVFLCGLVASISLIYAIHDDAKQPWRAYYEKNFGGWRPYLITNLLRGLMLLAGFVLFVIPGIILAVQFVVAEWIAMLEGVSGMKALHASRERVRGRWWTVAWRVVALVVLSMIFGFAVMFFSAIIMLPVFVAQGLFLLFLVPFSMIVSYLLYQDITSTFVPTTVTTAEHSPKIQS